MRRGYFGIGILNPKFHENVGTLIRSAHAFQADFVFTIGQRFQHDPQDTTKAERHLPIFHYETLEDAKASLPSKCPLIPIEVGGFVNLPYYRHPERAAYLLGPEDGSIPGDLSHITLAIPTKFCLNVAMAGTVVMYDRWQKQLLADLRIREWEPPFTSARPASVADANAASERPPRGIDERSPR